MLGGDRDYVHVGVVCVQVPVRGDRGSMKKGIQYPAVSISAFLL